MIRDLPLLIIFSMLGSALMTMGCYEVDSELESVTIYNPADKESGEELIGVDSIHTTGSKVEFFLHVKWDKIGDTSKVHRIRVHREGALYHKEMAPGEFNYFVDINVASNQTYYYQFAILTEERESSKKSKKYKARTK